MYRSEAQGFHSLTDVPVFVMGPCQELFGGVYGNIDIFFNMAECLGLARSSGVSPSNSTSSSSTSTLTSLPVGAAPAHRVQQELWVGMLILQIAIRWFVLGL
jgi:hypothetical protein